MPEFKKTLTTGHLVLFGLAYMAPIIVLGTFGVLAQITEGHVAGAYVLALFAMFFTACSYSQMSAAFPVAGSAYVYVRNAISENMGFLAGWSILLDYLFLPMVIWLIGAVYLSSAVPAVPQFAWLLAFIAVTTAINIVGLKVAYAVNLLLMAVQLLIVVAFATLAIHYIWGDASQSFWSLAPFLDDRDQLLPILIAGAAVACYSFLGFDAITTLAGETLDPQRSIPRAIMLITLSGGILFIVVAWCVQLAHPGATFQNADSAAFEIAGNIGGDVFVTLFMIGLVFGQFASGISAQASASRMLYSLGCDGVLPRLLGRLGRFTTPVNAIALCATVALLALMMNVTTSTSFINFGAFLAFTLVNLSVIGHYYLRLKRRGGWDALRYLVAPALGALSSLWLLISLDRTAIMLGSAWLALGALRLLWLRLGNKRLALHAGGDPK
ncbi:Amino acid/polyamine/organocation transporter, APC superfamily [Sodalis praecaptivus]|uniref:Amino acid/polyamine/organocation transporter, APC superfamily n=1 Tax=Sodalis praecaptivus TaxID=1239307 RepID=W0HVC2_9GAMM|nr:APC family permease [Sodalis praecaptivus]AHF76098.1 Amino acid/polyamine/organocation transporter, APC superfamily [Sodalis praecaptivus]